jgi:hypothetical protein
LLVLGSCSVLAANPFANLKPFFIHANAHSTFFFVAWFRVRMRVRWVVLVMSVYLIRID